MKIAVHRGFGTDRAARSLPALRADGHEVIRWSAVPRARPTSTGGTPQHRRIDPALLADVDAVINLGGTPIRPASVHRRLQGAAAHQPTGRTTTISEALAAAAAADPGRPRVLLSASAVGYYGDTGSADDHREGPGGLGLHGAGVRPVGGGDRTGGGGRASGSCTCGPAWCSRGRRMLDAGPRHGLLARTRRAHGQRPAVLAVDQPGRRDRRDAAPPDRRRLRAGQPDRARPGDQRRVHARTGPATAPPDGARRCPGFASSWRSASSAAPACVGGQRAMPVRLEESGYEFTHTDLASALRTALTTR